MLARLALVLVAFGVLLYCALPARAQALSFAHARHTLYAYAHSYGAGDFSIKGHCHRLTRHRIRCLCSETDYIGTGHALYRNTILIRSPHTYIFDRSTYPYFWVRWS